MLSRTLSLLMPLALASTAVAQTPAGGEPPGSWLGDMFENAGVIGWVIVGVSIIGLALIIECFVSIKREKLAPPETIDELEALFEEKNFEEAAELCESDRKYLTNVVAAGLGKLGHSFETMQTAMREMEDEEAVKLYAKIGWLSLISATAPMLGLFGTVTGMFVTFGEIAAAGGSVSPAQLAKGIKMALVTTIFGLTVAIPVGAFFFYLRNRITRIIIEVNAIAEDFFERFREKDRA